MEILPFDQAMSQHREQWSQGKNKGSEKYYSPPLRSPGDERGYVQAQIPVQHLNAIPTSDERVEQYKQVLQSQGTMGPSWGKFSGKSPRVYLFDGNHRALAAQDLGHSHVSVMMPAVDYERYRSAQGVSKLGKSQREKDVTEVVSVIVFGKDDKILMGLRGDTGKWCLPGGHAEPGENLLEAAKRELLEETGLSSEGMERLGWCDVREGLRVHTFVCRATGTPDAGGDPDEEMVAFKWLSADNLPKSVAENLHNKKDVSLQFLDAQEQSLDLVWDEDGAGDHEGRRKFWAQKNRPFGVKKSQTSLAHSLPKLDEETWDDGTQVVFRQSPFPYRRAPALPSRLLDSATVEHIPLAGLHGSQSRVTEHGVEKYSQAVPVTDTKELPLVYAEHDGSHTVGDGHHRLVAAYLRGETTAPVRVVRVPNAPLRTRLSYRGSDQLGKFETDLGTWLAKATRPEDFKQIARAITPEGPRFVDHRGQLSAHPAIHNPDVEAYRRHVLDSPGVNTKAKGKAEGITRKVVFKTVGKPQGDLFAGQPPDDARYMVKPYHEGIVRRISSWQKHPIQGWAEMTNQALYHAGGIGHLHQNVHVAEHNMGPGHEHEPALVVKMAPGMMPLYGHPGVPGEAARADARKIGVMDFLTNNLDRHGGNLLMDRQGQKVMAIDHSRSFQYVNNHSHKWDSQAKVKKENNFEDSFGPYIGRSVSSVGQVDPYENNSYDSNMNRLKNYAPVMDWWGENSAKIKAAMDQQLEHIKDPDVKAHIRRNFDARAKWLDERAKLGLENYGTDWHRDPVVQYHPHQRSDDEIEAEKLAQLRAQP